jgi:hypothetical protein
MIKVTKSKNVVIPSTESKDVERDYLPSTLSYWKRHARTYQVKIRLHKTKHDQYNQSVNLFRAYIRRMSLMYIRRMCTYAVCPWKDIRRMSSLPDQKPIFPPWNRRVSWILTVRSTCNGITWITIDEWSYLDDYVVFPSSWWWFQVLDKDLDSKSWWRQWGWWWWWFCSRNILMEMTGN